MSFAVAQPPEVRDVPASVLETNLAALSEARERDNEWNQSGLNSGLNPLVCFIFNIGSSYLAIPCEEEEDNWLSSSAEYAERPCCCSR